VSAQDVPTMTVADLARHLRIGRNQAYALAKSGQFHTVTVGRRIVIPRRNVEAWLEGRSDA